MDHQPHPSRDNVPGHHNYWWLHALTTPQLATGDARRLRQEGVSATQADRGVAVVTEAVTGDGPQTRAQLRDRLDAAGVPTQRQALVHVLLAASILGPVVRGPMIGREQAFVWAPDWIGAPPEPLEPGEALARLARRYLAGHGPAGPPDLAKWAGTTLAGARTGFDGIADEVAPTEGGFVLRGDRTRPTPPPPVRLLGPFDPLLHGWQSRADFVGTHAGVVTTNGIFRPVALVDGRVVATWSLTRGIVTITQLEPIGTPTCRALAADAVRVLEFLALPETPVRFA